MARLLGLLGTYKAKLFGNKQWWGEEGGFELSTN